MEPRWSIAPSTYLMVADTEDPVTVTFVVTNPGPAAQDVTVSIRCPAETRDWFTVVDASRVCPPRVATPFTVSVRPDVIEERILEFLAVVTVGGVSLVSEPVVLRVAAPVPWRLDVGDGTIRLPGWYPGEPPSVEVVVSGPFGRRVRLEVLKVLSDAVEPGDFSPDSGLPPDLVERTPVREFTVDRPERVLPASPETFVIAPVPARTPTAEWPSVITLELVDLGDATEQVVATVDLFVLQDSPDL